MYNIHWFVSVCVCVCAHVRTHTHTHWYHFVHKEWEWIVCQLLKHVYVLCQNGVFWPLKMRSLYSLATPQSTLWLITASHKNKDLCAVYRFICLFFGNNWLSLHLTGRLQTISSLYSCQWVSIDSMCWGCVLLCLF